MGCLCDIFEDNKCLWIVLIAIFLLYCNGCGCGCGCNDGCGGGCGGRGRGGCGCD